MIVGIMMAHVPAALRWQPHRAAQPKGSRQDMLQQHMTVTFDVLSCGMVILLEDRVEVAKN